MGIAHQNYKIFQSNNMTRLHLGQNLSPLSKHMPIQCSQLLVSIHLFSRRWLVCAREIKSTVLFQIRFAWTLKIRIILLYAYLLRERERKKSETCPGFACHSKPQHLTQSDKAVPDLRLGWTSSKIVKLTHFLTITITMKFLAYDADYTHTSDVGVINIFNTTGENRPVQTFTVRIACEKHLAVANSNTIYDS